MGARVLACATCTLAQVTRKVDDKAPFDVTPEPDSQGSPRAILYRGGQASYATTAIYLCPIGCLVSSPFPPSRYLPPSSPFPLLSFLSFVYFPLGQSPSLVSFPPILAVMLSLLFSLPRSHYYSRMFLFLSPPRHPSLMPVSVSLVRTFLSYGSNASGMHICTRYCICIRVLIQ